MRFSRGYIGMYKGSYQEVIYGLGGLYKELCRDYIGILYRVI